ncbi:MAG: DinB family protein [Bacteroidia bacterium]|nr:DinB family protein [Bacteroidia bacterium]
MNRLAADIEATVISFADYFRGLDESVVSHKSEPGKWSKKEILGHLVDSAQNNLQRFVRGQYELLPKIVYAQDEWVSLQHYQQYATPDLVDLWVAINKHLCHVLRSLPAGSYTRHVDTGKGTVAVHTLQFLADDYLVHLRHHLDKIKS